MSQYSILHRRKRRTELAKELEPGPHDVSVHSHAVIHSAVVFAGLWEGMQTTQQGKKSEESCPSEQMSEWTGLPGKDMSLPCDLSRGHALLGFCLLLEKGVPAVRW